MRPSGLREHNPFMRQKKKSGGQKLGLDLERIQPSQNHNQRLLDNTAELKFLRQELQIAERLGRWSKSRKLRRFINQHLEVELYLRNSWCGGCHNVLHNCQCEVH